MDLSAAATAITSALTSSTTGIPKLVTDMAPLLGLGVVVSLFFGLLGRAIHH